MSSLTDSNSSKTVEAGGIAEAKRLEAEKEKHTAGKSPPPPYEETSNPGVAEAEGKTLEPKNEKKSTAESSAPPPYQPPKESPSSVSSPKPGVTEKPPPNPQPKSNNTEDGGGGKEDDDEDENAKEAAKNEVKRILKTNQGDYVGVLGIKDKSEYGSDDVFKNAVLDAFARAGMLTNPGYNKTEGSYDAFKLVKKAAKNFGVSSEDIEAVDEWEGEPDERVILRNGRWVPKDDTDMTDTQPHEDPPLYKSPEDEAFYKSVYEKASPYLLTFVRNTEDSEATSKIQEFNREILAYNQKKGLKGLEEKSGYIEFQTIAANVQAIEHWRQVFLGNPADTSARQKFEDYMEMLKKVNEKEGYPSTWLPDPLPSPTAVPPKTTAAPPGTTTAPPGTTTAPPGTTTAPPGTTPQETDTDWKWTTGLTADGERIMAYRTHGRGHRCLVETEKGTPVFQIKSGSEVGLLQVKEYLKLSNIKQLADPESRRKWSYKNREDYKGLEWLAMAPYKTHNPFSKSGAQRTPETWCGAKWTWGSEELTKSELERVLGPTSAESEVRKMCNDYNCLSPGDLEPEQVLSKPTKRDIRRRKAEEESNSAGKKDSTVEALLMKMDTRMDAIEKELHKRESSPSRERGRNPRSAADRERSSSRHSTANHLAQGHVEQRIEALESGVGDIKKMLAELLANRS